MAHQPPTRFYLAARYSRRDELLGVRDVLSAFGHEVTSRWLDGGHQADPNDFAAMHRFATEDIADLRRADIVVAFTETPRVPHTNRGGRHVELGIAWALGKRTYIVGPYENAFTTLCEQFPSWSHFVRFLTRTGVLAS